MERNFRVFRVKLPQNIMAPVKELMMKIVRRFFRAFPKPRLIGALTLGLLRVYEVDRFNAHGLPIPLPIASEIVRSVWRNGSMRNLGIEDKHGLIARGFESATLSPNRRGGYLLSGRLLLSGENEVPGIPQMYFSGTSVGSVVEQKDAKVLIRKVRPAAHYSSGIFVGSLAPHNWFHWLIDTLPGIFLANLLPPEYDHYPLVIPKRASFRESWLSALNYAANRREVIWVDDTEFFSFDHLVWVPGASLHNPRPQGLDVVARIGIRPAVIEAFRIKILATISGGATKDEDYPERVFIGRKDSEVRGYNQDEIFQEARKHGFVLVFLESMTFEQSVLVFKNARVIVSPHGAGLANLIFCERGTKLLMWTWADPHADNWYENLCYLREIPATIIHTRVADDAGSDPRTSEYELDLTKFSSALVKLLSRE